MSLYLDDGVILADHVKSADWRTRRAEYADRAPADVRAKLRPLLGI